MEIAPTLAALRAALDIVEVADRLGLEPVRTSGGGAKILCPSHAEDSPSCLLYADGHAHCFGCGFHGSTFDLISTVRGVAFGEAVEWAADAFGLPRPTRDAASAARSACLREVREALRAGLEHAPELPGSITREAAEAVGLGYAGPDFAPLVEAQVPAHAPLAPAEARTWSGHFTLEVGAKGGISGVGAIIDGLAGVGASLARPRRATFPAVAGLAGARGAIDELGALYHVADPLAFLGAKAAGVRAIVTAGRSLDPAHAEMLAGLSSRIVLVRKPGAGLALDEAAAVLGAGARVAFSPAGADGVPGPAIRLSDALERGLAALSEAARRRELDELLGAVPSRSSRELYRAELVRRGLL